MTPSLLSLYRKHHRQLLQGCILLLEVILAILVFLYPIQKPIPVGVDAGSYITDAHWIQNTGNIPSAYEPTYYNYSAYVSPLTSVLLTAAHQMSGVDITYPLFSAYQVFLIVLLVLSSFLVGGLYGRRMAAIFPVIILGSFSIIRLFMGSTVANLLAFSFMNLGYFFLYQYFRTKRKADLFLLVLFVFFIYLTHSYLSAPFYILALLATFAVTIAFDRQRRRNMWSRFAELHFRWRIVIVGLLATFVAVIAIVYLPIGREAMKAFVDTNISNSFRMPIPMRLYASYVGDWLLPFCTFGLILYALQIKKHFRSYTLFPLLWVILILASLQAYRFGVSFFFERILFLGGIVIALFAAYFLITVFKYIYVSRTVLTIIIGIFLSLTIRSGVLQVHSLYKRSNLVTENQIVALQMLHDTSPYNAVVYSHTNGVSQTAHDVMVSERYISHYSTFYCEKLDVNCQAFNDPMTEKSKKVFRTNGVQYFLFMKPSVEGNAILDRLLNKYQKSDFQEIYSSSDAWLFKMN